MKIHKIEFKKNNLKTLRWSY